MRDEPGGPGLEVAARRAVSPDGLVFIKAHEGFQARAVKLDDGRWLLGHSAVEADAEGREITADDAEERLRRDLQPIEDALNALVFAPLTQAQFDALVSLGFSIGEEALRRCGVAEALNDGRPIDAAAVFDAWREGPVGDALKPIDALVRRRAAEKAMFLALEQGPVAAPSALLRARAAALFAPGEPASERLLAARPEHERSTIERMVDASAVSAQARTTPDPQLLERLARILPEPTPSSGPRGGAERTAEVHEFTRPPSRFPPAPYPLRRGMASPGVAAIRTGGAIDLRSLRFDGGPDALREQWPWIVSGGGLALAAVGVVNLRALAAVPDGGPAEVGWALAAIAGLLALATGVYHSALRRSSTDE